MEYKKIIDVIEKPQSGEWGKDDETGDGIPVLRTTNFTDVGEVNYSNVVTRCIDPKKIEKKALKKGDIIIEKSGGSDTKPVGRVIYFDGEDNKYLFNNFTSVLRVKENIEMQNKYLFYYLFHFYRKKGTVRYENKTTGLHNLKLDQMVNDVSVPIIMKEEQEKFCEILDKVYGCIKLRKEELVHYDNLIKSRFVEMFGDPVSNPKKWNVKILKDICEKLTDGTHFSPENLEEGDYKYITAKNIKTSGFDFSNITYVSKEVHDGIYSRCNPEFGDVLYIKDGVTTGIAMVNSLDEEFSLLSSVALLKQNRDIINGYYLCGTLNNNEMYSSIRKNMGGAAITRLTITKLNIIRLPVPPIDLQNQFSNFVQQVDKLKVDAQKSLDETQLLFDSLMQKYFE